MKDKILIKANNSKGVKYYTLNEAKNNNVISKSQSKISIIAGEYAIVNDNMEVSIQTLLGSCIAVCIYDVNTGIYGVNHFLTPIGKDLRHGNYSINSMLSEMIKLGCNINNMSCKIYGGGNIQKLNLKNSTIGSMNSDFVFDYLKTKGLNITHHIVKRKKGILILVKPLFLVMTKELS
jgi:chemotaxis receptor (MCP) glutamine deamidase CheD